MEGKSGVEARANAWVVVPAYNEASVVPLVVKDLSPYFTRIVVVDDGSSDGTAEALSGLGAVVLRHATNLGQGAALQTGITYALSRGAAYVVTFDADGQHRPEDAAAMLAQFDGAEPPDAVLGSRFLGEARNIPRLRRLLLKLGVLFSNATTGTRLTDTHNGLRVLSRKAASTLSITQNGMAHASEILHQLARARMVLREHPVTISYTEYSRAKGQSSLGFVDILFDLFLGRILR